MANQEQISEQNTSIITGTFTIHTDLHCPKCGFHHIDRDDWAKRLHKKHLCEQCGHIWQPHEGYTFGA